MEREIEKDNRWRLIYKHLNNIGYEKQNCNT